MSIWQIELIGNTNDISALQPLLADSPYHIELVGDKYYLALPGVSEIADREEVYAAGKQLVDVLNGVAKLNKPDIRSISFSDVWKIAEDGSRTGFGRSIAELPRHEYYGFDPDDPTLLDWIQLGLSDSEVARALYLYGSLESEWNSTIRTAFYTDDS